MSALLRDTRADAEHFARLEANFREGVELGRALASSESCADQGQRLIDDTSYRDNVYYPRDFLSR